MNHAANIIQKACAALQQGDQDTSRALIQEHYPFRNLGNSGRSYSPTVCTQIFIHDGFIDRYSVGGAACLPRRPEASGESPT